MASKLCDVCKSATATLYCRADTAFLCASCDCKVHAANKLASRHARVWVCEVCEQAPAHVTCKADAAALCVTCDRDIHFANPLARRHDRVPVTPFYDPVGSAKFGAAAANFLEDRYFSEVDGVADVSREEEEAASWLLLDPNPAKAGVESPDINTGQSMFSDMDPYLDLEYAAVDPKIETTENSSGTDGVVPQPPFVNEHSYDLDFSASKHYPYGYSCISQTVSTSSMDVGLVPDSGAMAEISNPYGMAATTGTETTNQTAAVPLSPAEREARVLRYREKRKNRKFEKTIRYASRKAYAEVRPRIKGRFAKRSVAGTNAVDGGIYGGFGVVPSF